MQRRRYRITRTTRAFVWIRSINFGPERRGLSLKIPSSDFDLKYVRLPHGLAEKKEVA